ncbi:MAG: gp436 family protein [Thermodesulfobacteriota bacterium]
MPYATLADILEQLPEIELIGLTDDAGAGTVDDAVVDRAIADADAFIDAHCQGRYPVPLSPAPSIIRSLSVDLAIYNLFSRRPVVEVPEARKDRRQTAIGFLVKVAEGKILLGAASPEPTTTGQAGLVSGNGRIFTRDSMGGL